MEKIKYFFECYFNQAWDYYDLNYLIKNYKSRENQLSVHSLINELHQIITTNNYELVATIIDKHGGRIFDDMADMEKFIKYIYDRFLNIPTTVKAEDFYSKLTFCPRCNTEPYDDDSDNLVEKATVIGKNVEIYICKFCKIMWPTKDIRVDNAQDYKKFMQLLGLKGTWKELYDVDFL
jgi:hypothetical protein